MLPCPRGSVQVCNPGLRHQNPDLITLSGILMMGFDNECVLNIQTLPGEYFCPVCRTLICPNEALQTQCTHLYCKPCLAYIVATTQACPYDGYLVTEADSKPLMESNKPLAETIGKVTVHCQYHKSGCQWHGNLSDCITHVLRLYTVKCKNMLNSVQVCNLRRKHNTLTVV
uniref:RING-type domain-containing protein n=1 Tax=Oryza meridionalis TaxID=40149 RepID=A0A0E0D568_9ORYZ